MEACQVHEEPVNGGEHITMLGHCLHNVVCDYVSQLSSKVKSVEVPTVHISVYSALI